MIRKGGIVSQGQLALRNEDVYPPPPPPLWKRRGRKYASLRKYETDVDDYFENSGDEEYWNDIINERMHCNDEDTSSQSEST